MGDFFSSAGTGSSPSPFKVESRLNTPLHPMQRTFTNTEAPTAGQPPNKSTFFNTAGLDTPIGANDVGDQSVQGSDVATLSDAAIIEHTNNDLSSPRYDDLPAAVSSRQTLSFAPSSHHVPTDKFDASDDQIDQDAQIDRSPSTEPSESRPGEPPAIVSRSPRLRHQSD